MTSDIKDSIKARLYDMKYTPFVASYLFLWAFFNAKSILIFFSDKLSVMDKINMLSYSNLEYFMPLYLGILYTVVFPIFNAVLYAITLHYKKLMNFIKQKIQDTTPLPQEEANKIIRGSLDLELKLNTKIEEINKLKLNFETQINEYIQKEKKLENLFNKKVSSETKILHVENAKLSNDIKEKNKKIKLLSEQIDVMNQEIESMLKNQITNEIINNNNMDINLTNDERRILKIIYDNDISKQSHSGYIDKILSTKKFKRIKVQDLLKSLEKKGIIKKYTYEYDITEEGEKIILALFDVKT